MKSDDIVKFPRHIVTTVAMKCGKCQGTNFRICKEVANDFTAYIACKHCNTLSNFTAIPTKTWEKLQVMRVDPKTANNLH